MSSDHDIESDLFKRLGLSTNAEYDSQLRNDMSLIKGASGSHPSRPAGGNPAYQQQQQAQQQAYYQQQQQQAQQQAYYQQQQQQQAYYQQQQQQQQAYRGSKQQSQQQQHQQQISASTSASSIADRIPSNPFLPSHPSAKAVQNGADPNPQKSTAHRAPGATEEDDVLKRLGLCSNEEYTKKSKAEYKQAVNGLLEVQQRWSQMG